VIAVGVDPPLIVGPSPPSPELSLFYLICVVESSLVCQTRANAVGTHPSPPPGLPGHSRRTRLPTCRRGRGCKPVCRDSPLQTDAAYRQPTTSSFGRPTAALPAVAQSIAHTSQMLLSNGSIPLLFYFPSERLPAGPRSCEYFKRLRTAAPLLPAKDACNTQSPPPPDPRCSKSPSPGADHGSNGTSANSSQPPL